MGLTARQWRSFYAAERDALGTDGLERWVRRAHASSLAPGGALVFPHTRLSASGRLVAAAARSVVLSGAERVLAIGVLHGARECDSDEVRRARAGDPTALEALRRVHTRDGYGSEEFSLDGFRALVEVAARVEGRRAPEVIERYPFLVGDDPLSLPGVDELREIVASGAALVATADPIHHGVGYETPPDQALPLDAEGTRQVARESLNRQLSLLAERRFSEFRAECARVRSDFRDAGPVLSELWSGRREFSILDFELVSYADVLAAPEPTWVLAALVNLGTS